VVEIVVTVATDEILEIEVIAVLLSRDWKVVAAEKKA
jgi:hypothetical protein